MARFATLLLVLGAAYAMKDKTPEPEDSWFPDSLGKFNKIARALWGAPDETQTGCTPPAGSAVDKPTADMEAVVNEPCYIHDGGTCVGYQVCCVKIGTCLERGGIVVSSNAKYYEGGCISLQSNPDRNASTPTEYPDGCVQQGECHAMYLEHMKGATAEEGVSAEVSPYVVQRLMEGAEGCEEFWSPPLPVWVFIVIAAGAAVVLIAVAALIKIKLCKKAAPAAGAKA
jgi:hypothetical protein